MDTVLARQLAIIVLRGMQGYIGIGDIVPQIGRKYQNSLNIPYPHGIGQPVPHEVNMPRHYAVGIECVFRIFFNSILPVSRHFVDRTITIPIYIQKMA